jgi:phage baseplate assembly protein W
MPILYRGFSTQTNSKKFRLADFDLVRQDLINHFGIRKGEKLMNPEFGTIIWNMLFDPLTPEVRKVIIDDIKQIIGYDPRLAVDQVILDEYEHGLQIEIDLRYVTTDQRNILKLRFDRERQTMMAA